MRAPGHRARCFAFAMRLPLLVALALSLGAVLLPTGAAAQARAEVVGPTEQIPRGSYKTWSLFLVCNPDWVSPEKSADLANLYRRFTSFGDAIGRDNLAVWFWKRPMSVTNPQLAENVDVARSAEFCGALRLPPSQGPYLVVTTAYPDVRALPPDRAVYTLGGQEPAKLAKLLNTITDQLLLSGRVETGTDAAPPQNAAPNLWFRFLEATRQALVDVGCAVKLQISTGLFSAELRACEGN